MASAMASPTGVRPRATRSAKRPPSTNDSSMPATGTRIASTSREPPAVVAKAERRRSISPRSAVGRICRCVGIERDPPGFLEEPQHQRDRESAGGESDDDAGDHHRLRHGIGGESGGRAPARDDAEDEKDAAAGQIEGEHLAQRLRIDDEAVEAEADQRRAEQSRNRRCGHACGFRLGGPATSIGRVAAMESTMKASMRRMIGLAKPTGKAKKPPATRSPRGRRRERRPGLRPARAAASGVDPWRLGQPRHHHDHPHGGDRRAALKGAARLVGADPERCDADDIPSGARI